MGRRRTPTSAGTRDCGCAHAGFRIGPAQRDAWLRAMRVAIDESAIAEPYRTPLWDYLQSTAHHMVNSPT